MRGQADHLDDGGASGAESADAAIERLTRRCRRERTARKAAEALLESKSREIFELNEALEARVDERTRQLEASRRQALALASRDQLTGIANRTHHTEFLERQIAEARAAGDAVALLLIDLDLFREINDSLGHGAGDHALVVMAERFARIVRHEDLVARLGGDEFAIICRLQRGSSASVLAEICERVVVAASEPIPYADRPLHLSCSIGAAMFPDNAQGRSDLHRYADIALNEAKRRGRDNWVMFDRRMSAEIETRQSIVSDLATALRAPGGAAGAIELFWQPKVSLATGQIDGVEALCRWRHPERGLLGPGAFIDLAEQSGLIELLGAEVLRQGCRDAAVWIERGWISTAAINVSPRQLRAASFVRTVRKALRAASMNPAALEIEITENMIVSDMTAARARLGALSAEGVRIALDDFGAGYSNLGVLRALSLDVLKIDRAFVNDLSSAEGAKGGVDGSQAAAILRAMIEMGRALRLKVVGEGVETPAQAAMLNALGCDLGQGYYWAKPLPSEELTALLADAAGGRAHWSG